MKNNINYIVNKNVKCSSYYISRQNREKLHKHRSMVLWFTGLSGSGKSTLAFMLEKRLYHKGVSTYVLDGDNIRYGLCNDLSFSSNDRRENIRRAGEIARLMFDAGLVVLVAFISPYREDRQKIRDMFLKDCFLEIFVDTPIQICENRDPKNLYYKARLGELKNFTGIEDPYEYPECPDIHLDGRKTILELLDYVFNIVIVKIFS